MLMSFYECAGAESSIIESAEDLSARTTLIIAPLSVLSNWLVGIQLTQHNTEKDAHHVTELILCTVLLISLMIWVDKGFSVCHAFLLCPFVCVHRTSLSSMCALT